MIRRNRRITWISRDDPPGFFPPIDDAMREPNGLLAAGGDLSAERLLCAYRRGIFPWYEAGQPILWWSPDPRCVLLPESFRLAGRMRRYLKSSDWHLRFNGDFETVIDACAAPRKSGQSTWITAEMRNAFLELHRLGWAHSIEVIAGDTLIGGLYGLAIGRVFFGESMFSYRSNASKAALFGLCEVLTERDFELLDCQVISPHLLSLGATRLSRPRFAQWLAQACEPAAPFQGWPEKPQPFGEMLRSQGAAALQ